MKTNMDYSAHSATGLGGAVRRATMLLLMMLLTATTASGKIIGKHLVVLLKMCTFAPKVGMKTC